jgi:type II secretory ATPase GspE/PulE/Tfp pilus assembly ATPase PilB-like protein
MKKGINWLSQIRSLIEQGAPIYKLEQAIVKAGFKSMFDIAIKKIKAGTTDIKEIKRVLGTTRY